MECESSMVEEIKNEEVVEHKLVNPSPERFTDEKFGVLFMKQVPRSVLDNFKELSEREFGGHHGYCLKALIDQMVVQAQAVSELRMDEFEDRLSVIERLIVQQNLARENDKVNNEIDTQRKTMGGRVMKNG